MASYNIQKFPSRSLESSPIIIIFKMGYWGSLKRVQINNLLDKRGLNGVGI